MAEITNYDDPLGIPTVRLAVLRLEALSRRAMYVFENQYALNHLNEVNILMQTALVQLEYAKLAEEGGRG